MNEEQKIIDRIAIQRALAGMSEINRAAYQLWSQGYTQDEITERLGVSRHKLAIYGRGLPSSMRYSVTQCIHGMPARTYKTGSRTPRKRRTTPDDWSLEMQSELSRLVHERKTNAEIAVIMGQRWRGKPYNISTIKRRISRYGLRGLRTGWPR